MFTDNDIKLLGGPCRILLHTSGAVQQCFDERFPVLFVYIFAGVSMTMHMSCVWSDNIDLGIWRVVTVEIVSKQSLSTVWFARLFTCEPTTDLNHSISRTSKQ